jgi:hypothetical protein
MIYLLGHPVDVTTERTCTRSGDDHVKLKHEARADRQRLGFDVDESYALCLRCGKAVPLGV